MNGDYRRYFLERLNSQISMPRLGEDALQTLLRMVTTTEFSGTLRPDAAYFLVWNMFVMVADPVSVVEGEGDFATIADRYADDIQHDLRITLSVASEIARSRGSEEISSSTVAKALGILIDEYRMARTQVWGP